MQLSQQYQHLLTDKTGSKKYARGKLLGSGGFAKCFQATNLYDQKVYAAKVIPKKQINQKRKRYKLILQIKVHRSLKHQNIVGFRDVFQDNQNVYIILEYCRNNTLKDLIKRRRRLTEFQSRVYILQMVKALQFIHRNNIIHRDLKLGNILVNDNMQLKFCDFGLSTRINYHGERKKTVCGTPNYIAPQILEEEGHSYESDIWSLGVIIFTFFYNKPPYQSATVQQTYQNIRNNKYSFPEGNISQKAKDLIKKILILDPSKRLTLQQIKNHPFMRPIQQIPKMLPRYTLAIPPHDIQSLKKQCPKNDKNLKNYSEVQNYNQKSLSVDKSVIIKRGSNEDEVHQIDQLEFSGKKKFKQVIDLIYLKEVLLSNGNLGYLLSNGIMGVQYKSDKSELTGNLEGQTFSYIQKLSNNSINTKIYNNINQMDEKMRSKYDVFDSFSAFFKIKFNNSQLKKMKERYPKNNEILYIKKFLAFSSEILVKVSNKCLQLCFKDQTSLIMNQAQDKCLFYLDKNKRQFSFDYEEIQKIQDHRTQKKIKKFSNLLAELHSRGQQDINYEQ